MCTTIVYHAIVRMLQNASPATVGSLAASLPQTRGCQLILNIHFNLTWTLPLQCDIHDHDLDQFRRRLLFCELDEEAEAAEDTTSMLCVAQSAAASSSNCSSTPCSHFRSAI